MAFRFMCIIGKEHTEPTPHPNPDTHPPTNQPNPSTNQPPHPQTQTPPCCSKYNVTFKTTKRQVIWVMNNFGIIE